MAMSVKHFNSEKAKGQFIKKTRDFILKCNYCNEERHTREKCFYLHGYPPWHKNYGKPKSVLKKYRTTAQLITASAPNEVNITKSTEASGSGSSGGTSQGGFNEVQCHQLLQMIQSTIKASGTWNNNKTTLLSDSHLHLSVELAKQSYCELKVANTTDQHVAFKVKTTSPKKYFVRPNTGVIQPWDSCVITVTLQAQQESPPDMQCRDKFLIQSTKVPPHADVDELPQDTFNKESGRQIEELKLRAVYILPHSDSANADDDFKQNSSTSTVNRSTTNNDNLTLQRLRDERDADVRQMQQLQRELDMLRRRRSRKGDTGFSFRFALFVALIGIMVGFLLNLSLSSPSTPKTSIPTE